MGEGKYAKEEGGGSVFVLLVILVLIVGIVAAAGLVLAVLNYNGENTTPVSINVDMNRNMKVSVSCRNMFAFPVMQEAGDTRGGSYGNSYGTVRDDPHYPHYDESVWTFRIGNNENRLVYLDRKTRQQRGYRIDVLNAVCQIAGKNCEIIHADSQDCFNNGFPKAAILGRWLDGCYGYAISVDRVRSVKFSLPFTKAARPALYTSPGNAGSIDPNNLNGLRIGVLIGWWADRFCIFSSTGYDISENNVVIYDQNEELATLIDGLNNGEVDAIFVSNEFGLNEDGRVQLVREYEPCLLGGDAMLMRKDSLAKNWYDPAFEKLINSQAYRNICNDIEDPAVHGSLPGGSAEDMCVNL